jgi:hypothetical protein
VRPLLGRRSHTDAVAVVVPVYREELTADERVSLRHVDRFLGSFDRYLVMPESLAFDRDAFRIERFADRFFESKHNYSRLLLTRGFYGRFSRYEYVLLYQLDSLVLSDELLFWCARGHDYIGAVHTIDDLQCVGNGGFSLRRVASFLEVLTSRTRAVTPHAYWAANWADKPLLTRLRALPRRYAKHLRMFNGVQWEIHRLDKTAHAWPEDWFWSLEATRFFPAFRVAPNEDGDRFAFSETPRQTFEKIGRQLPFGCHGWPRFERDFWDPYLLLE